MDEMQILTARVDKLETKIAEDLEKIFTKLEALALSAASRRDCPQPGLCVTLQARMNEFEADKRDLVKEVITLQKWQSWMMGAIVVLATIITFFGPSIRHMLNIPQ
jgi:hypothetical protein